MELAGAAMETRFRSVGEVRIRDAYASTVLDSIAREAN
jgi:hypothetical protein